MFKTNDNLMELTFNKYGFHNFYPSKVTTLAQISYIVIWATFSGRIIAYPWNLDCYRWFCPHLWETKKINWQL